MTRLERYATETNKLIIRLHKLLTDRPSDSMQQKLHEQTVVFFLELKIVLSSKGDMISLTDSSMAGRFIGETVSELCKEIQHYKTSTSLQVVRLHYVSRLL